MTKTKPYSISKRVLLESWQLVRTNKGSAGIDGITIEMYEGNLKNNLYKLWNRMSSGSYYPSPVKIVEIPKKNGGKRRLGIPTVEDRIAQTAVKLYIEPVLENIFHENSYGYRPNKSAKHAVKKAAERCMELDWVIDLDIKGFFDNIDHDLLMKAVQFHIKTDWMLLYIKRWLKSDAKTPDGMIVKREKGTPQGGVISPLLANLYLHYTFDKWMEREYAHVPFERYADDCLIHCKTKKQAECVLLFLKKRMKECKLELHPEKTKLVYCQDSRRTTKYSNIEFNFLGFTFKGIRYTRKYKEKRIRYRKFGTDISKEGQEKIREEVRNWRLNSRTQSKLKVIADNVNSQIRGWLNYYKDFSERTTLYSLFFYVNSKLTKWAMRKYKKFKGKWKKAYIWLGEVARSSNRLFAHWEIGIAPMARQ